MTDVITIAKLVEDNLEKNEGYILLIFPFGVEVQGQFSTNVHAEDAIAALKAYVNELGKFSAIQ
jgi:hypothetical protein